MGKHMDVNTDRVTNIFKILIIVKDPARFGHQGRGGGNRITKPRPPAQDGLRL